jgi:hypothetical protein
LARTAVGGVSTRNRFRVSGVGESARGVSIPAPVGGLDAISPLAAMPETNAITLDNLFPQPGYVEIRGGHRTRNTTGTGAIESLMPYHGLTSAGDRLFAATSTVISDVTVSATVSSAVTGLTNARWQHTNFSTSGGNHLWVCNGADAPRMYNGTVWATASVVGITATDIVNVTGFKNRLWLVRNGQINPAYLNTDSVQGTATPFDLTGVFEKGGYLQAIGSWSLDAGAGPDDMIAFITNRGEAAIYSGTDPATNFVLKGVYEMGAPIGRRCLTKVGADLAVISIDGVLPLSRALITDRAAAITQALTKNIQPLINTAARSYGSNFGWQLIGYPKGTRAILNVPKTEGVEQIQYVMNTVTGAWCRFLDEDANCWAVFQDRLFYGGNDGKVREADCQGFDDNGSIQIDVETAYNYIGNRGRLKNFTMARALLTTDGQVLPGMGVSVDFARQQAVGASSFETEGTALWDVANWDEGTWPEVERIVTDWISVAGIGYCASIRMSSTVSPPTGVEASQDLTLAINGWDLLVLDGAFL